MDARSPRSIAEVQPRPDRDLDQVVRWRREQLVRTGLPLALAAQAAENGALDLHSLIELLEHQCPPELALRILAPLDSESPT
jgi:hypothetical protein